MISCTNFTVSRFVLTTSENHKAGTAYDDVSLIQNLNEIDQALPEIIIMRE